MPTGSGSFWEALRSWADSAGLLVAGEDGPAAPVVPPEVCASCPICQAAATLDQVNPRVFEEMAVVARNLLAGFGSAMASAADQRGAGPVVRAEPTDEGWPTGGGAQHVPTEHGAARPAQGAGSGPAQARSDEAARGVGEPGDGSAQPGSGQAAGGGAQPGDGPAQPGSGQAAGGGAQPGDGSPQPGSGQADF